LLLTASAHGGLVTASPLPNEPVVNPTEVRLGFGEAVTEDTAIQVVSWESFKEVQQGETQIDPAQPSVAFVALAPLEPGRYAVNWYAVMVDGASAEGSYNFDVVPEMPGLPPVGESPAVVQPSVPTPAPTTAPSPAPRAFLYSRSGILMILGVALTLLIGLLLLFSGPHRNQDV
jgi:methionine-rich copper-binding protein CopC